MEITFCYAGSSSPIPFADDDEEVPDTAAEDKKTNVDDKLAHFQNEDDDIYEDLIEPMDDMIPQPASSPPEALEIFSSAESSQVDLVAMEHQPDDEMLDMNDVMEKLDYDLQRINILSEEIQQAMGEETVPDPEPTPAIKMEDEIPEEVPPEVHIDDPIVEERQEEATIPPPSVIIPLAMEEDDDYNDIDFIDDDESQQAGSEDEMDGPFTADVFERHIQQPVVIEEEFRSEHNKEAIAPAVHIISTCLSQIMSKEAAVASKAQQAELAVTPYEVLLC